jgi:hypothetical protein
MLGVSRIFTRWIWRRLEWHKIWSLHRHGTIDHLGSIHFSYRWLCNWEHPILNLTRRRKSRSTTHRSSITLESRSYSMWHNAVPMHVNYAISGPTLHHSQFCSWLWDTPSETQPAGFSHIGWSELLPTSYKAKETSLVSCEHNRKTKRCLAHLCLLPRSTCLSGRWTRLGVSSCFSHLGWTKPKRKRKGYGVPN